MSAEEPTTDRRGFLKGLAVGVTVGAAGLYAAYQNGLDTGFTRGWHSRNLSLAPAEPVARPVLDPPKPEPIRTIPLLHAASPLSHDMERYMGEVTIPGRNLILHEYCVTLENGNFPLLRDYMMRGLIQTERRSLIEQQAFISDRRMMLFRMRLMPQLGRVESSPLAVYSRSSNERDWTPMPQGLFSYGLAYEVRLDGRGYELKAVAAIYSEADFPILTEESSELAMDYKLVRFQIENDTEIRPASAFALINAS